MKTTGGIVCGALLALSASWPAGAGEIVDTYSSGDTLTATMMNNIKAAVNDNNTATRFYGDGSAGDYTVSMDENWYGTWSPLNLNFADFTIEAGTTLRVPAGTTIRCNGRFVNRGTLEVMSGAVGGRADTNRLSHPGDTAVSTPLPEYGMADDLSSNNYGSTIERARVIGSINSLRLGGAGGSGAFYSGGNGGGLVRIYCSGEIVNQGRITAVGIDQPSSYNGGGGGGGGIVVLASRTGISNSGDIDVSGGNGGDGSPVTGAGGGGGGGIVVLISPQIDETGAAYDVSGGLAGNEDANTGTQRSTPRSAGGSGGTSGGFGGWGSSLNATGVNTSATPGEDGYVIRVRANPASML